MLLALLVLWASLSVAAERFPLPLERAAEVVAELRMSSPGSDWGETGREAAVAAVRLDGVHRASVMLYAGQQPYRYSVFLGRLPAGEHRLEIERDAQHSAPGSALKVLEARFRGFDRGDPYYPVLAHAPVLYARANTIGAFTDVPMLVYCERLEEDGQPLLQYTAIYSNEDGGTSTRALVARWGRTTDIDYVYKVWLSAGGQLLRATYQGKDHKETPFRGAREDAHPLLIVATDNNMVSDQGRSAIRYQIAPVLVDLSDASREQVMDDHPVTWQVMARELHREGKLRPFGTLEGESISDPRNYLCFDLKLANRDSGVAVLVRRHGEDLWWSSHLGRMDYAVSRNGWARTGVELPPHTTPQQIAEIALECLVVRPERGKWPHSGACLIESVKKAFFLGPDYAPGPSVWSLPPGTPAMALPSGMVRRFALDNQGTKEKPRAGNSGLHSEGLATGWDPSPGMLCVLATTDNITQRNPFVSFVNEF